MLQNAVDEDRFDIVIGADDSIQESDVFINVCNVFKIFHTNNTDFIIQLIHESVIFIDKYDASCAFFNTIVG